MNTLQENDLRMYYTFKEYVDGELETANKIPFFHETYQLFLTDHDELLVWREIQEADKSGVALDKGNLRKQLEANSLWLVSKLQAVAAVRKNQDLATVSKYGSSDLSKATDTRLRDIAGLLHKLAQQNLNDLAVYEITADFLIDYKTLTLQYAASIPKPKQSIDDKANATQKIEELFEQADEKLELMEKLVGAVREKYPDFVNGFERATKVLHLGRKSLALRGNAKDRNGNPLSNVTFEILSQRPAAANARLTDAEGTSLDPMLVKKTTENGNLQVKNLPDGTYTALVKKLGYQDQEVTFHVVAGEKVDLEVTLEPA